MANLIAVGVAQANSADFPLIAGQSTTLSLTCAAGTVMPPAPVCMARIQILGSGGAYVDFGQIDGLNPIKVLTAIGTFRVVKNASPVAFGIDRD